MNKRTKSLVSHFALFAFLLAVLSIGYECVVRYNEYVRDQQYKLTRTANAEPAFEIMGNHPEPLDLYRLFFAIATVLAWGFLIGSAGRIIPAIIYATSQLLTVHWLTWAITNIRVDWELYADKSTDQLALLIANPFDYLLFILIACLFLVTSVQSIRLWLMAGRGSNT